VSLVEHDPVETAGESGPIVSACSCGEVFDGDEWECDSWDATAFWQLKHARDAYRAQWLGALNPD
jgi:hypothetical protein